MAIVHGVLTPSYVLFCSVGTKVEVLERWSQRLSLRISITLYGFRENIQFVYIGQGFPNGVPRHFSVPEHFVNVQ